MKISEALKNARQGLGLSQKQFIADIISPAQYSRIENGSQEINLSALLKILTLNQINVFDFMDKVLSEYSLDKNDHVLLQNKLSREVSLAYYDQDITKLKQILKQLKKMYNMQDLKLRTQLVIAYLEDKNQQLDSKIKKEILNEFLKRDNWTENTITLHLLEQSMLIFDFDQISLLMNSIFKRYDNIFDQPFLTQDRVSGICINYLYICYQSQNKVQATKTISFLKQIPKIPELFIYQIFIKYYEALFSSEYDKANDAKKVLKDYGFENIVKHLPY